MSNLKNIVPPVDICKRIPAGEFVDSALVWVEDEDGIELVMPREVAQYEHDEMIPAPTLEEILEAIDKVENWDTATIIRPIGVNMRIVDTALKRWFKVKGIQCE